MADFLRNLLTFKYFRSKDCCSNGAHRERVCKFWSKQEWEADKSSSKSSSLHAPQSRYQELEVALDSSSATINQLNENVESLRIGELEQAPSAVSMQQQEEDRNSENKSALQLEQQVKELQEKQLSEVKEMEMKEDIWTLRRRRCLSPCQASWRTWRAGRPWPGSTRGDAAMRPGFMVSVRMVESENSRCQVVAGNNNEIWPAEGCNTKSQFPSQFSD
ncbi:uncharacterized protein isoform X6 [Macaca fascicularis]|uniref:uncharacterized protein isoform X6 n=1 Tax=Macaca fascicularis TaxID=9541 RepID=UPI0032B03E50